MFQMSSIGPIFGQSHHFYKFNNGKSKYATERFLTETKRLYSVMDSHLSTILTLLIINTLLQIFLFSHGLPDILGMELKLKSLKMSIDGLN